MNSIASISTRKARRMIQRGALEIFPLYPGGPLSSRVVSKHSAARAARHFARHGRIAAPVSPKARETIRAVALNATVIPTVVFRSALRAETPNFPYLRKRFNRTAG